MTRHELQLLSLPATPEHLILQDLSQYRDEWGPEYPRLSLQLPGRTDEIDLPFSPSETNVFRKEQIGGSLPDGVYTARYSVAPHDRVFVCYTFLRTETLDCRINHWLTARDWTYEPTDSSDYQKLIRMTGLLLAARAEVAQNTNRAIDYYQLASRQFH